MRKFINVVIIPNVPFSKLRVILYKAIGYKIGKKVFIGMKCYLDDMDPSKIIIEDNVTISYGVYFACHGINQKHTHILIKKGAYIGMRATIISGKNGIVIGENSIIGAGSLVNKSVEDNVLVAGVPIKKLKRVKKYE
ncbi:DapH/DapD/GlmU-related protein [Nitratiruptor sp. YY09-18]|uniref:acyltransferase n=1 Tax=Nitratiruptor sp. YY09-18 TaxID=2724901 RepID=UPI0019151B34|nr:acyltransferase [Nitratiruptor sp. YY09-18]